MNVPQKNEASLLKKAKNGDKDAFNLMVIKYQPRIMSVLYGFLTKFFAKLIAILYIQV